MRNLDVKPDVMGKEHHFHFEKCAISIKIPSIDQVNKEKRNDGVASVEARRVEDDKPLYFHLNSLDVEVLSRITVSLPAEILNRHPNAIDLLSEAEQRHLNNIADDLQLVAEKAFEYWIRITRWVCDDSSIGRNQVGSFHSGWSTHLQDAESKTNFWIQRQMFIVPGYKALSVDEWLEIEKKLLICSHVPIYIEFMHDAEDQISIGNYRRSLMDMAIACEAFLRLAVLDQLPDDLNSSLAKYLERAPINQYVNKFFLEVIDKETGRKFKKLKSALSNLFKKRNKLFHMGEDNGIDEELCLRFLKVTQELLSMSNKSAKKTNHS